MLSIILSVYNGEVYIEKCINSIINQTYKDIELIIIDDGSKDLTSDICMRASNIDDRVHFYKQQNLGVSAARNFGLRIANGQYITFIDCDDWIDSTFYEQMMVEMQRENADIVISGFVEEYPDGKLIDYSAKIDKIILDRQTAVEKLFCKSYYQGFLWNKIYKKKLFFQDYLDEKIHLCEDLEVNVRIFLKATKIIYCPNIRYHYYKSGDSITTNIDRFFVKQLTIIDAYNAIIEDLEEANFYSFIKKIKYIRFRAILNLLISIRYSQNRQYDKYFCLLKKEILHNINGQVIKFFRGDDLIRIFLFLVLPHGYVLHKYLHCILLKVHSINHKNIIN